MKKFEIRKNRKTAAFLVEQTAYEGVKLIAETVAEDIRAVCGAVPEICAEVQACQSGTVVLMASLGRSPLLERLEQEGKISLEQIRGKREVYLLQTISTPFEENTAIRELLVIAGSDKRGTIYGMFRLSEICGVSPLIYFGDAAPEKREELEIAFPELFVSKEPSVRYRGFFINDEWPAFGNWCMETFGGINAAAYRKIFELLLRLKGNYMWPAMWDSAFSEDGPGLLNAQLADALGVVIGFSHHEPMCRSGVEWQRIYRQYGTDSTWSFISNAEAITAFWREGILRNKDFENVVTIGMRGENDSMLMPADATRKDNIEVIKKAIRAQHALLKAHYSENLQEIPRMLAIYKEVEDYYFGDETCEGLKDWDELQDVIFLLSDDNHGHLRALPEPEDRKHPGGYGMYYHFDYHGGPISYEWTNCNRLTKTWEQMTQAYEAGVREMWIVNVGDLKGVEYPLCYFMELAYDYETWGSSAPNKTKLFAENWIDKQFGSRISQEQKQQISTVLEGYTKWNAIRTPESMRKGLFHPTHFHECERVWKEVNEIAETADRLNRELSGEALITYQSIIYYPAAASLNLVLLYLEAGLNQEYAKRGCLYANYYGEKMRERIQNDSRLVAEFHACNDGKWNHCMSSAHTGFRSWDARDWAYPTIEMVMPHPGAKAVVSFRGDSNYHLGAHWQDKAPLMNDDFIRPDTETVVLYLDSRGNVSYNYTIEIDSSWLLCPDAVGRIEVGQHGHKEVHFRINRELLDGKGEAHCCVKISFDDGQTTESKLLLKAENSSVSAEAKEQNLFVEHQGYCAINAEHFSEKKDVAGNGFEVIAYLGREGAAVKAFPPMKTYLTAQEAPYVKYSMIAQHSGSYQLHLSLLSRNPSVKGGRLRFAVSVNDEAPQTLYAVSKEYYAGGGNQEWGEGVLCHARTISTEVSLKQGRNDLYVYAGDPGVILEKIVFCPRETDLPDSYLGPQESYASK